MSIILEILINYRIEDAVLFHMICSTGETVALQVQLLGFPDKGRAIKGLVVCNSLDLEPLDLLKGLALGCYQPSPGVRLV